MRKFLLTAMAAGFLAGCASTGPEANVNAPAEAACPKEVPTGATCYTGEDGVGSFYWIAIPANWDRKAVVLHAHGGPADTGASRPERSLEDLQRWAVTVKAGFAWAGSTYRRGGYGVTMAAEDTERLRRIFVRHFGQPQRTLLHGQSYGGGVASKAAELFPRSWDGVLLTSSVLGGGQRAYNFRLDLRAVYQYVCRNHPRADEPQYPLWMGLPADSQLTRQELATRVDDCTGVRKPEAQRTPQQRANLATLTNVLKIPASSLQGHLNFATWLFRDITQLRMGNRNPFTNVGVVYRGSNDDNALNAGVQRYAADPAASAELVRDGAPQGKLAMPVLTLHAINDPTAFVELESLYREIVERGGSGDKLVQVFTSESEHSYLADAQYPALFTALLQWVERGDKPTPQKVLDLCKGYEPGFGGTCRIQPAYQPPPYDSRVAPRP
jgi:pimeloyl-ACP methyl ester carboxylesterase